MLGERSKDHLLINYGNRACIGTRVLEPDENMRLILVEDFQISCYGIVPFEGRAGELLPYFHSIIIQNELRW